VTKEGDWMSPDRDLKQRSQDYKSEGIISYTVRIMPSSEILCRVALARTKVSGASIASIIRVTKIDELGTTPTVRNNRGRLRILRSALHLLVTADVVNSPSILFTPMIEAICPSETSVLTSATRRHIPEYGIFHSHCRENFKPYIQNFCEKVSWEHGTSGPKLFFLFSFANLQSTLQWSNK
jgi:hypothetical protein